MSSIMLALVMVFSMSATAFAQSPKVDTDKATYELTIGNTKMTLKEGERAKIPLIGVDNSEGGVHTDQVFVGDKGTLELWAEAQHINYKVTMSIPATGFTGLMEVTDLTTGFSGGRDQVEGFSGYGYAANLKGHTYSASLNGTATLLGVVVAKTVPNLYIYKVN